MPHNSSYSDTELTALKYNYKEMAGECQFERGGDGLKWWSYDYDSNYDFNDGHEDAIDCFEWCKMKSGFTDYAVGCYFETEYNSCIFIQDGNITGAGVPTGDTDFFHTCWKFDLSNEYIRTDIFYEKPFDFRFNLNYS